MRLSFGRLIVVAGLAALGLAASGCTRVTGQTGYRIEQPLVDSIKPGIDNKASVEGTLGRPTFAGQFTDNDWYYVSRATRQLAFNNPRPTETVVLHVRFDPAGNVVGVENSGLEKVAHISPEGDKTATLGAKRSLFQEIFGNIGAVGSAGAGSQANPDNTGRN